jgi:hypothetical protein
MALIKFIFLALVVNGRDRPLQFQENIYEIKEFL